MHTWIHCLCSRHGEIIVKVYIIAVAHSRLSKKPRRTLWFASDEEATQWSDDCNNNFIICLARSLSCYWSMNRVRETERHCFINPELLQYKLQDWNTCNKMYYNSNILTFSPKHYCVSRKYKTQVDWPSIGFCAHRCTIIFLGLISRTVNRLMDYCPLSFIHYRS